LSWAGDKTPAPIIIKMKKPRRVKCPNEDCGYEWTTMSDKKFVCCPSCLKKVNIEENRI